MALQIFISSPFINSCSSQSQYSFALSPHLLSSDCLAGAAASKKSAAVCSGNGYGIRRRKSWEQRSKVKIKASSETAVTVGQVTEVNKDTFWPIVNAAGEKVVVLDMYTQWCGPCKVMTPKFQELSEKHLDVVFLKLDCNQDNKPLAKELGIRVVPTFKILKDNKVVKEVTGAKLDDLVAAIEAAKSS